MRLYSELAFLSCLRSDISCCSHSILSFRNLSVNVCWLVSPSLSIYLSLAVNVNKISLFRFFPSLYCACVELLVFACVVSRCKEIVTRTVWMFDVFSSYHCNFSLSSYIYIHIYVTKKKKDFFTHRRRRTYLSDIKERWSSIRIGSAEGEQTTTNSLR